MIAFAACGYKCFIRECDYTVAPRPKAGKQPLERDVVGHLLCLNNELQMRENLIPVHWEQNLDVNGKGCPAMVFPLAMRCDVISRTFTV